jgi:hypothetical protein
MGSGALELGTRCFSVGMIAYDIRCTPNLFTIRTWIRTSVTACFSERLTRREYRVVKINKQYFVAQKYYRIILFFPR